MTSQRTEETLPELLLSDGTSTAAVVEVIDVATTAPPTQSVMLMETKGTKRRVVARSDQPEKKGRWTCQEHATFLHGMVLHGREWKRVAQDIPTRTPTQVRSHAQKFFQLMERHQRSAQYTNLPPPIYPEEVSVQIDCQNGDHSGQYETDDDDHDGRALMSMTSVPSPSHNGMSDSLREETERILANPKLVHAQVNETLVQLRQRYQQLHQRWVQLHPIQQQQQPPTVAALSHTIHPPTTLPLLWIRHGPPIRMNVANGPTTTGSEDISIHDEYDHEQVALQVLQGRLQQPTQLPQNNSSSLLLLSTVTSAGCSNTCVARVNYEEYDGDIDDNENSM
jgi:SHAQKYF class myb-like DNA-binding protein